MYNWLRICLDIYINGHKQDMYQNTYITILTKFKTRETIIYKNPEYGMNL